MFSTELEEIWVDHIQRFFENKEDDPIEGRTISIFDVPKTLKSQNPEAYTPQLLALGPYHHWRDDINEMERYKLIAARKAQSLHGTITFEQLVGELCKVEHKIRACYHKHLMMKGETLAWMMAIDGLFLLQFLHIYVNRNESVLANSTRLSFLVDSKGSKLGYNSMLKDIMMLENQIPIYVLKKILKIQGSKLGLAENMLPEMLLSVCKEIAPLRLKEEKKFYEKKRHYHLLDILYNMMVPRCSEDDSEQGGHLLYMNGKKQGCFPISTDDKEQSSKVLKEVWKVGSVVLGKMINGSNKVIKAVEAVITNVTPQLSGSNKPENNPSLNNGEDEEDKAPPVEEIKIPSVNLLTKLGLEFQLTKGDLKTIRFDEKTKTFYLPDIKLDENSEVILRNLVAYEAAAISGALVMARYVELMNGIIDTVEDVEILVNRKIIKIPEHNGLRKQQVADMWNGMSKAIRLSKVDFIDKEIEKVNKYYYSTKRVKIYRAIKACVNASWRVLVIVATLLVIGLMCIQSFCTVYDCPRYFNLEPKPKF